MPTSLDPLSTPTRAAKRNVLIVALMAITYRAFDVSIKAIPVAGLSIEFDGRVFVFLLLVSLTYFVVTFLLYYFIDIKNIEPSMHELGTDKHFTDRLNYFTSQKEREILAELDKLYAETRIVSSGDLAGLISNVARSKRGHFLLARASYSKPPIETFSVYKRHKPGQGANTPACMRDASNMGLYRKYALELRKRLRDKRRQFLWLRFKLSLPRQSVRAIYFFRNYGTDGFLPIGMAVLAYLCLYGAISLDWLRHITPAK